MNAENIANMKMEFEEAELDIPELLGTWQVNDVKSYYFLKGYAHGNHFINLQKSLILARQFHKGQFRKNGANYIVHPLRVCSHLVALGMEDDILLSAALLHDVVEDIDYIKENPKLLVDEHKLDPEVLEVVMLVTKKIPHMNEEQEGLYYEGVKKNWRALLIKLSDRVNNISTMQDFSKEKRAQYIEETRKFVLPLCSYAKLYYPELSSCVTLIKYHITSICDTLRFIEKEDHNGTN